MFGLGAGVFFIGYFLFEVPSNLIMQRFSTGEASSCTISLTSSPTSGSFQDTDHLNRDGVIEFYRAALAPLLIRNLRHDM